MSKQKSSKLDPFAETLRSMDQEGQTLAEIQSWLKDEGVSIAASTLSVYLESLRQLELEQQMFTLIASGARMNKELDAAYRENPAPDIDRLITVTKSLVMSLQVKGAADPKLLSLANSMQQTVLLFLSAQTKAQFKEREVTLAEQKAAEAKKSDQQKALEFCLEEAKEFPGVIALFKGSFAALTAEKARQESRPTS